MKSPTDQPKVKRTNTPLRRGDSPHYRALQEKSMAARVSRNFEVQIKLLPGGTMPFRKRKTDAGLDLTARQGVIIRPGECVFIPTGVCICSPEGYAFFLVGRSSLISKGLLVPTNVIDATYTGEVMAALHNTTEDNFIVEPGDRIVQVVFFPILHPSLKVVQDFTLDPDARGQQGFGSTGR